MVHLFECLLRKDFCVADVGANIGCTSILFGELAARVISFEPSPSTFRYLQQNIRRAGLANVELCNYGLGAQRGDTKLTFSANNRAGAFISGDMKTSSGHVVEAVHIETLDDVIDGLGNARLDFIKIDAEGFEKDVIEGARDVISRDEPLIVLELNHWCLNAFRRIAVPDFLDYLRSIFPLLYAVENTRYLDLHDEAESYIVMGPGDPHGRRERDRHGESARVDTPGSSGGAFLPGVDQRNVRKGAGANPERDDALLSAQSLRGCQALCALDHDQLSRKLWRA